MESFFTWLGFRMELKYPNQVKKLSISGFISQEQNDAIMYIRKNGSLEKREKNEVHFRQESEIFSSRASWG